MGQTCGHHYHPLCLYYVACRSFLACPCHTKTMSCITVDGMPAAGEERVEKYLKIASALHFYRCFCSVALETRARRGIGWFFPASFLPECMSSILALILEIPPYSRWHWGGEREREREREMTLTYLSKGDWARGDEESDKSLVPPHNSLPRQRANHDLGDGRRRGKWQR